MEIEELPLDGALLISPRIFVDERGYFEEVYSFDRYRNCGIADIFVQDNVSVSRRYALRGLHGDARMAKLVGVVRGALYDVIVDLRPHSRTYRRWYGTTLRGGEGKQVYIPRGFLHGFLALEDETILTYKQSAPYDPAGEFGVAWDDPSLKIAWPLEGRSPLLSARDAANPRLGKAH